MCTCCKLTKVSSCTCSWIIELNDGIKAFWYTKNQKRSAIKKVSKNGKKVNNWILLKCM